MSSSKSNKCLACGIVTLDNSAICELHEQEYLTSLNGCRLTDYAGKGRIDLNATIFNRCTQLGLQNFWGPEYLEHVLQRHSHNFAGALECERWEEHIRKYFKGIPDESHKRHCLKIADKVPRRVTEDHLFDIAIACLEKEAQETGNGYDVIVHPAPTPPIEKTGCDPFFVFSFETSSDEGVNQRVNVHPGFAIPFEVTGNGFPANGSSYTKGSKVIVSERFDEAGNRHFEVTGSEPLETVEKRAEVTGNERFDAAGCRRLTGNKHFDAAGNGRSKTTRNGRFEVTRRESLEVTGNDTRNRPNRRFRATRNGRFKNEPQEVSTGSESSEDTKSESSNSTGSESSDDDENERFEETRNGCINSTLENNRAVTVYPSFVLHFYLAGNVPRAIVCLSFATSFEETEEGREVTVCYTCASSFNTGRGFEMMACPSFVFSFNEAENGRENSVDLPLLGVKLTFYFTLYYYYVYIE